MLNIRKDGSQHRATADVSRRVASSQFHQFLQALKVHANFTEKTGDDLGLSGQLISSKRGRGHLPSLSED